MKILLTLIFYWCLKQLFSTINEVYYKHSFCFYRTGLRIGKGEGFADLEWAMMSSMGAVTQDTVVITTVHECQVSFTYQ